jgi:N-methylhydantoinase A
VLRIGVDIGGTFTDFCGWRVGDGDEITTLKVPSSPPNFEQAFEEGFDKLLERLQPAAGETALVMHGTTVSTNAVIERDGPPIALLVTEGYRDILEIQRLGVRTPLNMHESRPLPLIGRGNVYEIHERLLSSGEVRTALDEAHLRAQIGIALAKGVRGFAIAFVHSYRAPHHEQRAAEIIREMAGADARISLSSEIWPRVGEYERAIVAVLNAFVSDKMNRYISRIETYLDRRLPGSRLFVTRSNGGAMAAEEARGFPVHTLLSGPASGITAVEHLSRRVAVDYLLTLDMGGTSTDISLVRHGKALMSNAGEVGDFPLVMPVTGIEAIGAGGGSIAQLDAGVLKVGPESAGARPGPVCFGRGGERPTVTDAHMLSGYLPEALLGGNMRLDRAAARQAFATLGQQLSVDAEDAADMTLAVATSNMVSGVMPFLARQGVDPEDLTLLVFGGGGALHGPLLARELGIKRILVPTAPSVFCAVGGLVSDLMQDFIQSVRDRRLGTADMRSIFGELATQARSWLAQQAAPEELLGTTVSLYAEARYEGQAFDLTVEIPGAPDTVSIEDLQQIFHDEHLRLYSHNDVAHAVMVTNLTLRIRGSMAAPGLARSKLIDVGADQMSARPMRFDGIVYPDATVHPRRTLGPDAQITGPAVIEQPDATIVVPPDYVASVTDEGNILIERK